MKFLCVSPNPAVDKRVLLDELKPGQIHRVKSARAYAGGKAAHVAMTLRTLGESPLWIGFVGGETGADLVSGLNRLGIRTDACPTQEKTRVNLELIEDNGRVSEILEPGGTPTEVEVADFQKRCESVFAEGREELTVIFSGSLPQGLGAGFYASLISSANSFGCRTFLDTSGEPLCEALAAGPQFVKPNRHEAEALLGQGISDITRGAIAVRRLVDLGARSAAISLGEQGLLWCAGQGQPVYHGPAIALQARSTVGCGDAAVAAFANAVTRGFTAEETVKLAAACAAANCLADSPGAARSADIENFRKQAQVHLLNEAV